MSIAETMNGLPLVETFHSLQGEGLHAGRSAFFIRLGGCKVGCNARQTYGCVRCNRHASRIFVGVAASRDRRKCVRGRQSSSG